MPNISSSAFDFLYNALISNCTHTYIHHVLTAREGHRDFLQQHFQVAIVRALSGYKNRFIIIMFKRRHNLITKNSSASKKQLQDEAEITITIRYVKRKPRCSDTVLPQCQRGQVFLNQINKAYIGYLCCRLSMYLLVLRNDHSSVVNCG